MAWITHKNIATLAAIMLAIIHGDDTDKVRLHYETFAGPYITELYER